MECKEDINPKPTPDEEIPSQSVPIMPSESKRSSSTESLVCRICQSCDKIRLISPCLCKGTMKYVHRHCLERWLDRSGLSHCELCLHSFQTHETLRYSCMESLLVWYRNPNNRGLLLSDALIYCILSIICFVLTTVCIMVLQVHEQGFTSLEERFASSAIICFLVLVLFVYITNLIVIGKDHAIPWYRWWRSSRRVQLSEESLREVD